MNRKKRYAKVSSKSVIMVCLLCFKAKMILEKADKQQERAVSSYFPLKLITCFFSICMILQLFALPWLVISLIFSVQQVYQNLTMLLVEMLLAAPARLSALNSNNLQQMIKIKHYNVKQFIFDKTGVRQLGSVFTIMIKTIQTWNYRERNLAYSRIGSASLL